MARKASSATLTRKADKLAGEACRGRGYCESQTWVKEHAVKKHKCSARLEWAHIKSRGVKSLRWDEKNCVCLCNICHRYFTQHPDEFKRFIDALDPDRWDYLNEQWQMHRKPDPEYWIGYYSVDLSGWGN